MKNENLNNKQNAKPKRIRSLESITKIMPWHVLKWCSHKFRYLPAPDISNAVNAIPWSKSQKNCVYLKWFVSDWEVNIKIALYRKKIQCNWMMIEWDDYQFEMWIKMLYSIMYKIV